MSGPIGEAQLKFIATPLLNLKVREMPSVGKAMLARAELAAQAAQDLAPRGETGDYADSIGAVEAPIEGARGAIVRATDFKAAWIEFGTANMPAFAPLRRGAEMTGLAVVAKHGGSFGG